MTTQTELKVEWNTTTNTTIENELKKSQVKVIKVDKENHEVKLKDVVFDVLDSEGNVLETIITDKNGEAMTSRYPVRDYEKIYIKEKRTSSNYKLDETPKEIVLKENDIIDLTFENERDDKPEVDIEKTGINETTANQEIRYDFKIKNTGNVALDNFTWYDYLPSDYVTMKKLVTGTYNQDLNYNIYYKTNLNDYKLLAENLNTKVNNFIDFSNIQLQEGEVITEFKADFGTVDVGFESVEHPYIFVKVHSDVKNGDSFVNKTKLEGLFKGQAVSDEDSHETRVYDKNLNTKLARTGY